jgi:FlaA1/EpsC-like NDP-sugar epimerase
MKLSSFNNLSRTKKRILSVLADSGLITIAYWGAFWVRLDKTWPITQLPNWGHLALLIPFSIFIFIRIGLYRAVLRYVTFRILGTITVGMLITTVFMVLSAFYFQIFLPRTTSIIYFAFAMLLIGGLRLIIRGVLNATQLTRTPVVIYGAGASGRQLQTALYQGQDFYPIAFIDDNPSLVGSVVQNLRVYHASDLKDLVTKRLVKKILLAIPSCSPSKRSEIISSLENISCEVLSVPNMSDLISGRSRIDQLNMVSIDDLLGRESAQPIDQLLAQDIFQKNVLVTGAGGSIGSELCRQIIKQKPSKLVLFELSEYFLYQIHRELEIIISELNISIELVPLLGSVQRYHRLESVFKYQKIHTIYHAAAYKHVPIVENNIVEGIRNNVFGTLYAAQAAIAAKVQRFVLISTDKAVRPTNTMGATKRFAELILQALSSQQSLTNFGIVRFGNVLGSSGSVIPLFKSQLKSGGPLTVTHEEITRYFMTIPEASQLVIQAGAMSSGGDVFLLDMGEPVRIYDLAKRIIRLSGKSLKDIDHPDGEIEIKITGLRPGEKLYEELLIDASAETTRHPRIKKAHEVFLEWNELSHLLNELDLTCTNYDYQKIRQILLEAPLAFQPTDEICDLLWLSIQKHNLQ